MIEIILFAIATYIFGLSGYTILTIVLVLFTSYAFQLYQTQESILYQPRQKEQPPHPNAFPKFFQSPNEYGLQYQELQLKTVDQQIINAYYVPAHRWDTTTKSFQPIINRSVAKSILKQIKQIDSLKSFNIEDEEYDIIDYDEDDDEQQEINENENQSSDNDSQTDDENIIEFETPSSLRAASPKSIHPTSKSKSTTKSTSTSTPKQKQNVNYLFESQQLHSISPSSTYDLYSIVHDTQYHIDKEIPTILWFHGNAGSISNRLPNLYHMCCSQSTNVLIIDYRGYGRSCTTKPSEEGLIIDAASSFAYLQTRCDINPIYTYIFGQSLGGGVSIALVAAIEVAKQRRKKYQQEFDRQEKKKNNNNIDDIDGDDDDNTIHSDDDNDINNLYTSSQSNELQYATFHTKNLGVEGHDIIDIISPMLFNIQPPKGLLIENTFTSIGDLVDLIFPFISPLKSCLLRLKWFSQQRLKHITTIPILFISSSQDEVLHPEMMKVLHDTTPHTNKALYIINGGHHNDAWIIGGMTYCTQIQQFLQLTAQNSLNIASLSLLPIQPQQQNNQHNHTHGENCNHEHNHNTTTTHKPTTTTSTTMKPKYSFDTIHNGNNILYQPTQQQLELAIHQTNDVLIALSQNLSATPF